MNIFKAPSSSQKHLKVVKLRRKLEKNEILPDQNPDFILETGGDIRKFLTPTGPIEKLPRFPAGKLYKQNIIGGITQLKPKNSINTVNRMFSRKSTFTFALRNQIRQTLNGKEDPQKTFENTMKKITSNIELTRQEENAKLSSMKDKEKQFFMKQSQSIDTIYQSKLLESASKTSDKSSLLNNEFSTRTTRKENKSQNFELNQRMGWYMSLRESHNNEHIESYMRIGSELNGLYTKVKKKNPYYIKTEVSKLRKESEDLTVVGRNKLELEVDAVKKVGFEFLRPELINKEEYVDKSIICHSYNSSLHVIPSNSSLSISRIEQ